MSIAIEASELGASCIDIYLVAYEAENYRKGKENFFEYIFDRIS